jgi:hypothetical protein
MSRFHRYPRGVQSCRTTVNQGFYAGLRFRQDSTPTIAASFAWNLCKREQSLLDIGDLNALLPRRSVAQLRQSVFTTGQKSSRRSPRIKSGRKRQTALLEERQMPEAKRTPNPMVLDQALSFALILAWDDLFKGAQPRFVRVEYIRAADRPLDHLGVWLVKPGGYQDLVCNCWMSPSLAHSSGVRFGNGFASDQLAQALEFIMNTQNQFTHSTGAGHHLVLVYPPDGQDRTAAAPWRDLHELRGQPTSTAAAAHLYDDRREDEKAYTRMDGEGYASGSAVSMPDATGFSG